MKEASFVFIDEFDAFYHFELSESVQKHLKQISGVQIFTTTHNTDLMSNDLFRPDSYFVIENNSIRAISELTKKELRQAHNLQKMYKAGAFNIKCISGIFTGLFWSKTMEDKCETYNTLISNIHYYFENLTK